MMNNTFRSARLVAFASLIAAAALVACSAGGGGSAVPASPQSAKQDGQAAAIVRTASGTVPPMGAYNSCSVDSAFTSLCWPEDQAMANAGLQWEINYNGLEANANPTGAGSMATWFIDDASIGMNQVIDVSAAAFDPVNVLTGNYLITHYDNSLANTCPATNNEQIISCVYAIASGVQAKHPAFNFKWYLYDKPDCPNLSIGYCQGTYTAAAQANIQTLANYINSIDGAHQIIGTNVGDWNYSTGKPGEQA